MITAMEIRNQQFKKSLRGFNEDEVRNFLVRLSQDYENLYSENSQLRENMQRIQYELDKYRKMEETMNNSIILAQQTAEEVIANARKEANLHLEDSKRHVASILGVYQEIIKRMNVFNVELKSQMNAEMEMLDKNQRKIEDLSNFFYGKDLKELLENLEQVTAEEPVNA
ncbi:MAG TPA: DivIVA domain-containing protein [Syntrophomonadaceae bacterium]|nr:DivIVA domain-containing protein [Syntrophomonadaceae bacterium]